MLPAVVDWGSVSPSGCVLKTVDEGNFKSGVSRIYSTGVNISIVLNSEVPGVTGVALRSAYLDVPARIYVRGPGTLMELTSLSSNASLYFDYTLDEYEVLEVDLSTLPAQVSSSTGADVSNIMLPTSSPAAWRLNPEDNSVLLKVGGATAATKAWLCYSEQAYAMEAIFCGC